MIIRILHKGKIRMPKQKPAPSNRRVVAMPLSLVPAFRPVLSSDLPACKPKSGFML